MKTLEILIKPSFESTRNSMGYSEEEDYNSDAVLFQQGYNIDIIKVEADDNFQIEGNYEGHINCNKTQYKYVKLKDEWDDELGDWEDYYEPGASITLSPGTYKFLDDGITIQQISSTKY